MQRRKTPAQLEWPYEVAEQSTRGTYHLKNKSGLITKQVVSSIRLKACTGEKENSYDETGRTRCWSTCTYITCGPTCLQKSDRKRKKKRTCEWRRSGKELAQQRSIWQRSIWLTSLPHEHPNVEEKGTNEEDTFRCVQEKVNVSVVFCMFEPKLGYLCMYKVTLHTFLMDVLHKMSACDKNCRVCTGMSSEVLHP